MNIFFKNIYYSKFLITWQINHLTEKLVFGDLSLRAISDNCGKKYKEVRVIRAAKRLLWFLALQTQYCTFTSLVATTISFQIHQMCYLLSSSSF